MSKAAAAGYETSYESFESLYRKHYSRLVKALCFVVLNEETAADIAQDSFLKLHLRWEHIGKYNDPMAWVYKVAFNKARDYQRYLTRLNYLLKKLAPQQEKAGIVTWFPEQTFVEALKDLPGRQRTAASLHYAAGFSQRETALIMGISEGAVKSHLSRAREALKISLKVEHGFQF